MRPRRLLALAIVALATVATPRAATEAEPRSPYADARDPLFLARALRIGATVAAKHVSPEGMLVYEHRMGATPAQLSADALKLDDVAIWTGCYAASLACRYHVMKDEVALAETRRAARGLDLLFAATGVPGCVCRGVGRPIEGEPPIDRLRASPLGQGYQYRIEPSRDSVAGIVLGLACLWRFVDDPEVQSIARRNLGALARRVIDGDMKIRDADGKVTHQGKLDPGLVLGIFSNAENAAIGLSILAAGRTADRGADLEKAYHKRSEGMWGSAVDETYTWLDTPLLHPSNLNLIHLALLSLAITGDGSGLKNAKEAFDALRKRTTGWMNGGLLACYLLAGRTNRRLQAVEELRVTLESMPADDVEWEGTTRLPSDRPVLPGLRPVESWMWTSSSFVAEYDREPAKKNRRITYTRADFLFAYWLARAAGELIPVP